MACWLNICKTASELEPSPPSENVVCSHTFSDYFLKPCCSHLNQRMKILKCQFPLSVDKQQNIVSAINQYHYICYVMVQCEEHMFVLSLTYVLIN